MVLSNGPSQRGAGLPGLRAESPFLSIRGALECARHMAPVHALTPTSDPGERSPSHGAAAPQQAGTASPRLRLLRDTGRSAAGCWAPDGRDYDRERPGRWDCSPGRHGAEPFRSPQVSPRTRAGAATGAFGSNPEQLLPVLSIPHTIAQVAGGRGGIEAKSPGSRVTNRAH